MGGSRDRKLANEYQNQWEVGLCTAPCHSPLSFLLSCFFPWCYVYQQRVKILQNDLDNRYVCCGGVVCGNCCVNTTRKCPYCCLALESVLCFWCAVSGNRWLIQSTFFVQNSPFDTFLIYLACICSWVRCILSIFIDFPYEIDCLVDLCYCAFQGCLQTQQQVELKKRMPDASSTPMQGRDPYIAAEAGGPITKQPKY